MKKLFQYWNFPKCFNAWKNTLISAHRQLWRAQSDPPTILNWLRNGWRALGVAAIIFVFVGATFAIFHVSGMMIGVFTPLLVGAIYAGMGLWLGLRFVVTGFAITALTLGGYFYLPEHFLLWMAFVTGGGLILAGVWFRTV